MLLNPCKECVPPKRSTGAVSCHSHCAEYIAWRKEYDELKAKERQERQKATDLYSLRPRYWKGSR